MKLFLLIIYCQKLYCIDFHIVIGLFYHLILCLIAYTFQPLFLFQLLFVNIIQELINFQFHQKEILIILKPEKGYFSGMTFGRKARIASSNLEVEEDMVANKKKENDVLS
jgi:hypothetical protein